MGPEEVPSRKRTEWKDAGDHWTREDRPGSGAPYAVIRNEGKPTFDVYVGLNQVVRIQTMQKRCGMVVVLASGVFSTVSVSRHGGL